jgi:hypothetical protein
VDGPGSADALWLAVGTGRSDADGSGLCDGDGSGRGVAVGRGVGLSDGSGQSLADGSGLAEPSGAIDGHPVAGVSLGDVPGAAATVERVPNESVLARAAADRVIATVASTRTSQPDAVDPRAIVRSPSTTRSRALERGQPGTRDAPASLLRARPPPRRGRHCHAGLLMPDQRTTRPVLAPVDNRPIGDGEPRKTPRCRFATRRKPPGYTTVLRSESLGRAHGGSPRGRSIDTGRVARVGTTRTPVDSARPTPGRDAPSLGTPFQRMTFPFSSWRSSGHRSGKLKRSSGGSSCSHAPW